MKRKIIMRTGMAILLLFGTVNSNGMTVKQDTLFNVDNTVNWVYKTIVPQLERIKFTGGGKVSNELTSRWNNVLNHLKGRKGTIANDVKKLLVSPSGKVIDLEMIKEFINIENEDSNYNIKINPELFLKELMISSDNLKDALIEMANRKE